MSSEFNYLCLASHHPESARHDGTDHILSGIHVHVHPFVSQFIDVFSWINRLDIYYD
jgi:hypothetical protein